MTWPKLTGQAEILDSSYLGFWLINLVSEGMWCANMTPVSIAFFLGFKPCTPLLECFCSVMYGTPSRPYDGVKAGEYFTYYEF